MDKIYYILIIIEVLTLIELAIRAFRNIHKKRYSLSQDFEKSISENIDINQKTEKILKDLEKEIDDCVINYKSLKKDIKESILEQQKTLSVILEEYTQLSMKYQEALKFEEMCRDIYDNGYTKTMQNKFRELFEEQEEFVNKLESENPHQTTKNHHQDNDFNLLI